MREYERLRELFAAIDFRSWQIGATSLNDTRIVVVDAGKLSAAATAFAAVPSLLADLEAVETRVVDISKRAREVIERLDRGVHEVHIFSFGSNPSPTTCPVHGRPRAIQQGDRCGDCWREQGIARQDAFALLREIAAPPASTSEVTPYAI